jgi:23S rRNA (pseudouridine1915-N3)-methyltransferase
MHILIAAVNRFKSSDPLAKVFQEYCKRMRWRVEVKEINPQPSPDDEANLILEAVPPAAPIILLDETGKNLRSTEFSSLIERYQIHGHSKLVFAIGGDFGHGAAMRARAEIAIAFGENTWPHLLTRVLLIEQLYRAQQIIAGHPYHRG